MCVTRGLLAMAVEGQTRNYRWSATPALLMADLHRAGVHLRKPPIYERDGIPGSGGPDWWKNRYEFIVCCSKGKLPWSDNTANGHPPIYGPGAPSHRKTNGERVKGNYKPPKLANAGNIIDCGPAGGGRIGSELAHETEAPFLEQLVEPFIKCFCRPGGLVLDPFCGRGTTGTVALRLGRRFHGIDIRESQVELTRRRLYRGIGRENVEVVNFKIVIQDISTLLVSLPENSILSAFFRSRTCFSSALLHSERYVRRIGERCFRRCHAHTN